jgi:hypothetical protein
MIFTIKAVKAAALHCVVPNCVTLCVGSTPYLQLLNLVGKKFPRPNALAYFASSTVTKKKYLTS